MALESRIVLFGKIREFTTVHKTVMNYENTPIQIHWKFYNQKKKIFR